MKGLLAEYRGESCKDCQVIFIGWDFINGMFVVSLGHRINTTDTLTIFTD